MGAGMVPGVTGLLQGSEVKKNVFSGKAMAHVNIETEKKVLTTTPNAFGGGTYGSDAIFVRDNVFIRVSVPRFSSTAGDPLNPMARPVFAILDDVLASSETE